MMIQPHSSTLNDAPMRMYGVERINVEDENTRLKPQLEIADQVKPESNITFNVKEANGKAMSYVIAIVDEGLLDLTRYKTPDPWAYFYTNEALGIRTWDFFDLVFGAYGGRIEQLFAIGGDNELVGAGRIKAERFKPVVKFIQTSRLERGKTATHTIQLPPYIGAVKVMVIASSERAKDSTEKSVKVRKPIMIQTTLPRVMGVNEEIDVPVTVFAMQDNIGTINVELKQGKGFTIIGDTKKSVSLDKSGEKMVYFKIKTASKECITKIIVDAKSSNDKSNNQTEIDIRNPNPRTYNSQSLLVNGNQTQKTTYTLTGIQGTNRAKIELSTIPAINLTARMNYLVTYPHGCIEQISSGAFAQLYITDISNQKAQECQENVKATLNMLNRYQLSNGGFAYWSGGRDVSQWGTIYAGHFMTEAIKKGYSVNSELNSKWLEYMTKSVNNNTFTNPDIQNYALYVLSLAGKSQRGAMNRMRERKDCSSQALWFLAGAYAKDNKKDIAQTIIANIPSVMTKGNCFDETFYSSERDDALVLSVMNLLGERDKSFKLVQKLAKSLNDNKIWLSTQSTAWMIQAITSYASINKQADINAIVHVGDKEYKVNTSKTIAEVDINLTDTDKTLPITIENKTNTPLHAVIYSNGIPDIGQEKIQANGLRLDVTYNDLSGNILNPCDLKVGTDFTTTIKATNIGTIDYTNVALNYVVPSGWEIQNKRINSTANDYPQGLTYQDIRDDRVLSYFNLRRSSSVTVKIGQTATYRGVFYLPSITAEAMYDGTVNAATVGTKCKVL